MLLASFCDLLRYLMIDLDIDLVELKLDFAQLFFRRPLSDLTLVEEASFQLGCNFGLLPLAPKELILEFLSGLKVLNLSLHLV